MIRVDMKAEYSDFAAPMTNKMIRAMFKEVVTEEGKEVVSMYRSLQSNFTPKNRSKIRRKTGSGRSPVTGHTGTIYSAVGTDRLDGPLVWLGAGTKVRYRTMSSDWRSRSKPGGGIAFSGSRRGMALGFNMSSKVGIEARNFRDDIIEKRYPRFAAKADVAFTSLFSKARWI